MSFWSTWIEKVRPGLPSAKSSTAIGGEFAGAAVVVIVVVVVVVAGVVVVVVAGVVVVVVPGPVVVVVAGVVVVVVPGPVVVVVPGPVVVVVPGPVVVVVAGPVVVVVAGPVVVVVPGGVVVVVPGGVVVELLIGCAGPSVVTGAASTGISAGSSGGAGTHYARGHSCDNDRCARRCCTCPFRHSLETGDEWYLRHHRQRAGESADSLRRDIEERPHHRRVELGARIPTQLTQSIAGTLGRLVGTQGGHRVVGIRNRDNPCSVVDLLTNQALRISRAVPPLVMVKNRVAPGGKKAFDRGNQLIAELGMLAYGLPLLVVEVTCLVEHGLGDLELADVMQQRHPAKLLPFIAGNAELLSEHVGICPGSLRMAAGHMVMRIERGNQ